MTAAVSTRDAPAIVSRIVADRPVFHVADRDSVHTPKGEPVRWNAQPETLALIAREAGPARRTVEIGSGASTVVFAAAGAKHMAITPFADEHGRVLAYCDSIGVRTDTVAFVAESSDFALPNLDPDERFDLAFLDGTHAFPYAILEWHFLRRHLEVGGLLIMDDVPIPAVGVLHRFLLADPDWERIAVLDGRAVAFRKLAETDELTWREQPFNSGYPDHRSLPSHERIRARRRHIVRVARSWLAARAPWLKAAYRRRRSAG